MNQFQPRAFQLITTLFAAVVLVSATAPAAHADEFDDLLAQAQQAKQAGDLPKTAALLRKAIAIKPLPALLNNLGRVLEQMGDYQGAVDSYQKVANDPKADANIRSLDAARIATLQAKLSKGWVLTMLSPAGSKVLIEGRPPAAPPGKEFPVRPGESTLEFTSPEGTVGALLTRSFPLGKRTTLTMSLTTAGKGFGRVMLSGITPAMKTLKVGDYRVRATGLKELHLRAGKHAFSLTFTDGRSIGISVQVAAGQPHDLAASVKTALDNLVKKDPDPPPVEESSLNPVPFVLIGLGAVAAGVGAFLVVDAQADRSQIDDATRDSRGVITSLSLGEALQIEKDANLKSSGGIAALGVGGALLLGGIIWAVVDASSGTETKSDVNVSLGFGSVGVGGRF